ncbi:MAG: OmpA family protein [Prevotella sp.]|nr:OmpA family protein [Prevotella sp.]
MKKLTILSLFVALMATNADAQGFLKRLKDRAVDAVQRSVESKVEDKAARVTNDAMDAVLDGKGKSDSSNDNDSSDDNRRSSRNEETEAVDNTPDATAVNAKSDFVRGSIILFEDDFANEQMGEFPSKWDVVSDGNAETAVINGKKYLNFSTDYNQVQPLMKNRDKYLPEVFTLEWDVFISKQGDYGESSIDLNTFKDGSRVGHISFTIRSGNPDCWGYASFQKGNSDSEVNNSFDWDAIKGIVKTGQWNHFAVSFNKRALKFYINGVRVVSQPNVAAPDRFEFFCGGDYKYRGFTNVILAKGGVDLYERNTTDLSAVEKAIMETGKFVTNNILFETGKATLKPESMAEIQKVADYMKKNPSVRFEVQGHTDNQGSDAVNDPLSQQRAEAVVKALEGLGCDGFNLRAVGKGSHEPVADNKTDAGRAKNRRVEFIKK